MRSPLRVRSRKIFDRKVALTTTAHDVIARLAHLSDLHFGKIAHPSIVDALVGEINSGDFTLVIISGDLTQRARESEYRAAAAMLEALDPTSLVVPGNHDVYPWWKPVRRIFTPLQRFTRHITDQPTPRFEADGIAVLGINSAHGRTVKGGRIGIDEQITISEYFGPRPQSVFKILVVHHHLTRIQSLGPHDIARKARRTLERATSTGVDLILCGHLHISHIEPIEIVPEKHRLVIASAGTATSSRGRREHRETNFYNVVTVHDDHFTIEERRFDVEEKRFASDHTTRFERTFEEPE